MSRGRFLLVDDDWSDRLLVRKALETTSPRTELVQTESGAAALRELSRQAADDTLFPSVVLLDIQLEDMSGFEVLERIRGDERLSLLPVVVLSTSNARPDIERMFSLGANAYLVKPDGIAELSDALAALSALYHRPERHPYGGG